MRGALELVDRLVEEPELVPWALDGGAQIGFQLRAVLSTRVHARVVEHVAVLAGRLGRVESEIRVAQQGIGVRVAPDRDPDADRPRGDLATVLELDGLAQDLGEAVGEQVQRRLAVPQLAQHDELVTAEAPDRVVLAHGFPEPVSDGDQQLVSGRVAEVVVDVLEAVHVDEQRPGDDAVLWRGALDQPFGPVEHEGSVGEPGEGVVERLVGELAVLLGQLVCLLVHERQCPSCAPSRGPTRAAR